MKINRQVINWVIIAAIAAVVAIVPGGGSAADFVKTAVSLGFLAALAFVLYRLYREHRDTLYGLGDRRRALVYIAAGILTVTFTATHRMWETGFGTVLWIVLVAAAVYTVFAVFRSTQRY
jgi:type IV secretory pathway TrbD component